MADALAYLRQRQENGGFNELLGMRVRTIREGYAEIELPAHPNNLNALGNAHGGAIYCFVSEEIEEEVLKRMRKED